MTTEIAPSSSPATKSAHPSETMQAAVYRQYGSAEVLQMEQKPRPSCAPGQVLVAVRAVSLNPYDWHQMTGEPLLMRMELGFGAPKEPVLGLDLAGVVEAVGEGVQRFSVGDEVFGCGLSAFAEYAVAEVTSLAHKPKTISFEEACCAGVAPLSAVQGLRNHGGIQAGQKVLINGASGGVGSYAIQLAKYFGAEVTGVCSGRNVELVKGLGADRVINYGEEDFTQEKEVYDLILDGIGNRKISEYKRCLKAQGTYVTISGPKNRFFGPAWFMLKTILGFKFGSRRSSVFMAQQVQEDFELFAELLASGTIKSVIDQVYSFAQIKDAMDHLETGRTRGKVVVKIV